MRKLLLSLISLLIVSTVSADEIKVVRTQIPQGGTGTIQVELVNTSGDDYRGFQFDVVFPEGVTFKSATLGEAISIVGREGNYLFRNEERSVANRYGFLYTDFDGVTFKGGVVVNIEVEVSKDFEIGSVLKATLKGDKDVRPEGAEKIQFTRKDQNALSFDDVEVEIEVVENIYVLDENSTVAPEMAENVNVQVNRTINPNVWSTLVLPFDMTAEQCKTVFGEDAEFAEFTGYKEDVNGRDVIAISVKFTNLDVLSSGLSANHPCLVKVSRYISGFRVDGVTVNPSSNPVVEGNTGQRICDMVGLYVLTTPFGSTRTPYLYLSGNKFYYATGKSTLKAFRAYFDFYDILSDMSANVSTAKIRFDVDGEATSIDGISEITKYADGVYSVTGAKVSDDSLEGLPAGVYIVNGKKVYKK